MIYNYDPHQKIKEKAHVIIEASSELHDMRLDGFIGMEGMVVSIVKRKNRNSGAWVRIVGGEFAGEEWFFPILALRDLNAKTVEEEFGDFII